MKTYFRLSNKNQANDFVQFAVRNKNGIDAAVSKANHNSQSVEEIEGIRSCLCDAEDMRKWDEFVERVGIDNVFVYRG